MAFPRWGQFEKAWEQRLGDERRSGFKVPRDEVLTMRSAYKAWREDERITGISDCRISAPTTWTTSQASELDAAV